MPTISVSGNCFDCDLIVFDMDGTLIDVLPRLVSMAIARATTMRNVVGNEATELWSRASGVDLESESIDLHGPLARAPRREDLIVAATVIYLSGRRWNEAKSLAEQIYNEADETLAATYRATLFPGVEDALRKMRNAEFKMAIASNAPRVSAEDLMRSIGLHGLFDAIVGADEVENPKPAPDSILLACERCGCTPTKAIYFGDMPMDIKAGRRASVNAVIAVRSEYLPASEIEDISDAIIDSFDEIQIL